MYKMCTYGMSVLSEERERKRERAQKKDKQKLYC